MAYIELSLDHICAEEHCDKSTLYHGYAPIYDKIMTPLRESPIILLEMGIQFGQSMRSWLRYFKHPSARFHGMDIAQEFKSEDPRYIFHLCDQKDAASLNFGLRHFDFIIDDAGHYASPQAAAFSALWGSLKGGGYYFIEDTFTLFHPYWKSPLATGDWLHELFSMLNKGGKQFHGRPNGNLSDSTLTYFEKSIESITSYPGLICIKKI